jgi:hypothetical protein
MNVTAKWISGIASKPIGENWTKFKKIEKLWEVNYRKVKKQIIEASQSRIHNLTFM